MFPPKDWIFWKTLPASVSNCAVALSAAASAAVI
jgi:hypothetical protein